MSARENALYKLGIPCVIFFKLKTKCSACDEFTPIWEQLCSEPRFMGKVMFIRYAFGEDPATGRYHHLNDTYKSIVDKYQRVPVFIIHLPHDKGIIDLGIGPRVRSFENMRDVIIRALGESGGYNI